MSLLKKILPPEEKKFYQLFENSAQEILNAAKIFQEIINDQLTDERLQRALDIKHKSRDYTHEILTELNNTFVTPIDREDIHTIAFLLNKITRRIIRGSVSLRVYRLTEHPTFLKDQASTLAQAAEELQVTVALLRKNPSVKEVTASSNRIKAIEHHGDEILFQAMDELFSGKHDALNVIKLRDIVKNIESALDSTFAVSDAIANVVLKNS